MIAALKRNLSYVATRPALRIAIQAAVSLALIVALVVLAQRSQMLDSLRTIQPAALALAFGIQLVAFALNSVRWQLLLRSTGVRASFGYLYGLYLIGLFFSLFLPTGTGGDAVRMYDVARRNGHASQVVVATLQERVLGLGASLLIGLLATLYFLPLLPAQLRVWAMLLQVVGALVVALLLYPALFFALFDRLWHAIGQRPAARRLAAHPLTTRVAAMLRPIREMPPLSPLRVAALLMLAIISVLIGITMYYILGQSLGAPASYLVYCLIVPLVWIIRMVPVSLGGLGVGEGAFVFLAGIFAIPVGQALAIAVGFLALQTASALIGGLLLALRMLRGTWMGRPAPEAQK